jgi:transcriptional regulator with GAF, ATPase, and Fis domain
MVDIGRTLPGTTDDIHGASGPVLRLRVIFSVVEGLQGTAHQLGARELVLGRGKLFGGMALDDPRISARHASLALGENDEVLVTDLGSMNGTLIDGQRVERAVLPPDGVLRVGGTFLQLEVDTSDGPEPRDVVLEEFVGVSPAAREVRDKIRGLASVDVSVLVLGPPGVGKERVASALHQASSRKGPLVAINCAVLTDELAGSELFGHVKGAFTGAVGARTGAFRKAEGGTLFLDEIGELPPSLQAKLLRVMEERRVRPVGSDTDSPVDVRLVAATNKDLPARVSAGRFRGDLFSRIAAAVVTVPPLRERRPDIVALAQHFLPAESRLHPSAIQELLAHTWPHNVRDLKSVLALLQPERGVIRLNELALETLRVGRRLATEPVPMTDEPGAGAKAPAASISWPDDEQERIQLLERLLAQHEGNVSAVARALGKHGSSLRRWIKLYGIDPRRFRA